MIPADPMPIGRPTAGWTTMAARDPMLAHAVAAHHGEWRPDIHPHLRHAMDERRGLPEVSMRATDHQMAWRTPAGLVRRQQEWLSDPRAGPAGWHATATLPDAWPETVVVAMPGRPLAEIVDLPGADVWLITHAERVPGMQVSLVLERVEERSRCNSR